MLHPTKAGNMNPCCRIEEKTQALSLSTLKEIVECFCLLIEYPCFQFEPDIPRTVKIKDREFRGDSPYLF